jgi:lipoprotein signal peptidase
VADSAIVIGCGLLILDQRRGRHTVRQTRSKTDTR